MRQGIVESSMGAAEIPIEFMSVKSNLYSAFVDMNTSADIQKGDSLRIWFEGRMRQDEKLRAMHRMKLNQLMRLFDGSHMSHKSKR